MTTLTAKFDGNVLVPEQPVALPTGVPLRVTVETAPFEPEEKPVWKLVVEIGRSVPSDDWARVPKDAARNLDHYLYEAPRDQS